VSNDQEYTNTEDFHEEIKKNGSCKRFTIYGSICFSNPSFGGMAGTGGPA
jgi:hypothetical protein